MRARIRRMHSEEIAFEQIYVTYFPRLIRFAETYLLNREEAENTVQDMFMSLWEHRKETPFHGDVTAYLFIILKNRCIDILRKNVRNSSTSLSDIQREELNYKLYSLEAFDTDELSFSELQKAVTLAVEVLPERCREIFRLSRIHGMNNREIARKLHISPNTVENQISIALKKLRMKLKDHIPLLLLFC